MPRIAPAKNDVLNGRVLEEVVALLRDGHTNVYPTAVDPEDEPLIRLEPIEGNPVAEAVGNLPALSPVKPGMELLEIDHTPVQTVITRDLDPYIASSTAQDRALREMQRMIRGQEVQVSGSGYLLEQAVRAEVRPFPGSSENLNRSERNERHRTL